jgi:2-oxoglutarate ferredoxin oxidoreductase subunit alpha
LPVPEPKPWGARGTHKGSRSVINSLFIDPKDLEETNKRLMAKYAQMAADDVRWVENIPENTDVVLVAYGSAARICQTVVELLAEQGVTAGLYRPVTLFPFPSAALKAASARTKRLMVVEMSSGQMLDDVRLAVEGSCPVSFYGRMGGVIPGPDEVAEATLKELGR